MKVKCKLCGETFNDEDFEVENCNGDIIVFCPNDCTVYSIYIKDLGNIKIIEGV